MRVEIKGKQFRVFHRIDGADLQMLIDGEWKCVPIEPHLTDLIEAVYMHGKQTARDEIRNVLGL
jgi:hypothetical protein